MKTTLARVVVTLAASISIVLAGAASVHATEPAPATIGLTIESRLYADEARSLAIQNTSTVPADVTFTPSGDWVVSPTTMTLAPDETASVKVTTVGTSDGTLAVYAVGTDPIAPGAQRSAINVTAQLFQHRPFNWWPVVLIGVGLAFLVAFGIGALVVRRHRQHDRDREALDRRLYGIVSSRRYQAHPTR